MVCDHNTGWLPNHELAGLPTLHKNKRVRKGLWESRKCSSIPITFEEELLRSTACNIL